MKRLGIETESETQKFNRDGEGEELCMNKQRQKRLKWNEQKKRKRKICRSKREQSLNHCVHNVSMYSIHAHVCRVRRLEVDVVSALHCTKD